MRGRVSHANEGKRGEEANARRQEKRAIAAVGGKVLGTLSIFLHRGGKRALKVDSKFAQREKIGVMTLKKETADHENSRGKKRVMLPLKFHCHEPSNREPKRKKKTDFKPSGVTPV